jgi:hypothetical protein
MRLRNMTNLNTIITHARRIAGNLTTYDWSDTTAIEDANEALNEFEMDLLAVRSDVFVEKSTLDSIVSGQSVVQFPTDLLELKRVDINFTDPTDSTKFYKATEFDAGNPPNDFNWDWFLDNQPKTNPLVDVRGGWFEVAPKADANYSNAIKIIYLAKLTITDAGGTPYVDGRFAATTDLLPFPLSLYPEALAYKMAAIFNRSLGGATPTANKTMEFENEYAKKMKKIVDGISTNETSLIAQPVQINTYLY